MIKFCLAFILGAYVAMYSSNCHADTIGVHLVSKHSSDTFERIYHDSGTANLPYNNNNYGLYYITDAGFTVGAYRNSYYRNTAYAGWTWEGPSIGPVHTSLSAALATGYFKVQGFGKLRPIALPAVRVEVMGLGVKLSGLPVGKRANFLHLSIERKF